MKWTEAQQQTIDTREKNILVSAAAGSGKTAVLVERIKQLVIKDKTDIDRFLITTFTNAASAEMKERLESAVKSEMEKEGSDKAFLRKQLDLLPDANISTFHTFALDVMRRYFYLTDLEPGFRIGDDTQISIMKNEIIDKVFEDRFEKDYEKFTDFLRKYSSDRSEQRLKENLISLYDEMRSIPEYIDWAEERCRLMSYDSDCPMNALGIRDFIIKRTETVLKESAELYNKAADVLEESGLEGLYAKAKQDASVVEAQYMSFCMEGDCDSLSNFLGNIKMNVMRAGKEEKDGYAEIKDIVSAYRKSGKKLLDDLRDRYYSEDWDDYDKEIVVLHDDIEYMIDLIKDFESDFHEAKHEKNIVDFDDVMHYAIKILKNETAAAEYREKFRYIFIDEFQDSNGLQEKIIGYIKGENNLFMVGDVKQSIYKFRLADPEIFREKYQEYRREEENNSIKIDLNSNFRSKKNVTGTVNDIFNGLMADYDEDARLHCTADDSTPGFRSQLHIIDKSDTGDDTENFFETSTAETALAAELIRENLGKEIYDVKTGSYRPAEYRDIAVLSRSRSMIPEIEKYLNNENIPAYGGNTGGYFEAVEVQVFINILKAVNNTRQDIPLISVMKSVIFGFTASELAEIRIFSREGSFFSAVENYRESGTSSLLRDKLEHMMEQLNFWKELSRSVSLEELVRILVYNTGYYDYCSSLPAGKQRTSNLQLLIDKAAAFEKNNSTGLYGFLSYIEAMDRNKLSSDEAKITGENENVVSIMTVHKSKGLEFPFVILAGAGKEIKFRGSGSPASLHKDLAAALPVVDKEECWHRKSILQRIIDDRKSEENIEEEIRILYVALTRAKDKLMIIGTVKDYQKFSEKVKEKGSFLEMVFDPMSERGDEVIVHSAAEAGSRYSGHAESTFRKYAEIEAEADAFSMNDARSEQIDRILSYRYPYSDMGNVRSKYSVTDLNRSEEYEDVQVSLAKPGFCTEKKTLSAAEAGTVIHKVMEKLDFRSVAEEGKPGINRVINSLISDGTIPGESRQYINETKIMAFFESSIGKRAIKAERLEKEREFIMSMNIDGADTIVQGIIDCYFCEPDGIVLIDYKNVRFVPGMKMDDIADRYRKQITVYRDALEAAEGSKVKEAYLYLFNMRKFIKIS